MNSVKLFLINLFAVRWGESLSYFYGILFGFLIPFIWLLFQGISIFPLSLSNIDAWSFSIGLLTTVIIPMIFEEIVFRGYLWFFVETFFGTNIAYVITTVAFITSHGTVSHMIGVIPISLMIATLRKDSNSIFPGIIAHGTNNLVVLILVQLSDNV